MSTVPTIAVADIIWRCCDEKRREAVIAHPTLNGIDYLEVIDHDLPGTDPLRQRTLLVHCFKPLPTGNAALTALNVQILGGERVTGVAVSWASAGSPAPTPLVAPAPPDTAAAAAEAAEAATLALVSALADGTRTLVVRTSVAGDFSIYTLRLITSASDDDPPPNFDPRLSQIDFGFKVQCPSDFDCAPPATCAPAAEPVPEINYLAKDYPGLRQLMLDRLAQLVPKWQQGSEADTGFALTELLACACDQLSYQQDAIATEAYIGTARRRVSLRRHAVLVDYPMHDGCNARTWVQLQLSAPDVTLALPGLQFLTQCRNFPFEIAPGAQLASAMLLSPLMFEALLEPRFAANDYQQTLYQQHNSMSFYTWSDDQCCLPAGATSATLKGQFALLQKGDVLVFEERIGPLTGEPGDADPKHRHVVRLTSVDASGVDPLNGEAVTIIGWSLADALPFPLCANGYSDAEHGSTPLADVSVARGNLVLVDHGQTIGPESLGSVPQVSLLDVPACSGDPCNPNPPAPVPPRYRPTLARVPLTQAAGQFTVAGSRVGGACGTLPAPYDPFGPAADVVDADMNDVVPQILLDSTYDGVATRWQAARTLLQSGALDANFVVEVDERGDATLRFGDGAYGTRPPSTTAFSARYRIGNGSAGNVGAEAIGHVVGATGAISGVRNPLAATGGVDAEDAATVRREAPQAFRTQERAVTADDYAAIAERDASIQRAVAQMRWTGSWHTVFITADPVAGADAAQIDEALPGELDAYRMAGVDIDVSAPHYVSLEIALHVCVKSDYFRSDVAQQLKARLGNQRLPGGGAGLFWPDNYTFGQSVYLSQIYQAARTVPGVAVVQVTTFQHQGTDDGRYLITGELTIGPYEIARLDNDPDFPEHGVLRLDLHGGK
ncbi:putative baseplate assembly protein [Paraburkholderia sp. JHI869]|uniref:putative baseplate assembly protein n=1 Tax=Paraburkholderia sp. JHI869 TaxID=3112959 RepID=UPI0031764290